jgi:DNA-binding NarL/FixJ family response regulator
MIEAMSRTVLIVDDHAGFRGFARRLLEADGFTVVGEAADGMSALSAVAERQPELVLLDIVLPDLDGFAVAERLADRAPDSVVVLTSSREAADFGARLARSTAAGFIHKDDLSGAALASFAGEQR